MNTCTLAQFSDSLLHPVWILPGQRRPPVSGMSQCSSNQIARNEQGGIPCLPPNVPITFQIIQFESNSKGGPLLLPCRGLTSFFFFFCCELEGRVGGQLNGERAHHAAQPANALLAEGSKSLLPCAKICQRVVNTEERFLAACLTFSLPAPTAPCIVHVLVQPNAARPLSHIAISRTETSFPP